MRTLDRAEVITLQVLNELDREVSTLYIVALIHNCRDRREAGKVRSPEPSLAGNECVASRKLPGTHQNRAQNPVELDRFSQLSELIFIEVLPRLVGVCLDR